MAGVKNWVPTMALRQVRRKHVDGLTLQQMWQTFSDDVTSDGYIGLEYQWRDVQEVDEAKGYPVPVKRSTPKYDWDDCAVDLARDYATGLIGVKVWHGSEVIAFGLVSLDLYDEEVAGIIDRKDVDALVEYLIGKEEKQT